LTVNDLWGFETCKPGGLTLGFCTFQAFTFAFDVIGVSVREASLLDWLISLDASHEG